MFLVLRVKTSPGDGVGSIHRNAHTRQLGGELPSRAGNKRLELGVFSVSAILIIITKLYSQL